MSGAGTQRWGFHRLDSSWAARVVAEAGIRPRELVVDLGAGDGALTFPLLAAGARVIAVELHAGRAERLREAVRRQDCTVLTLDLAQFTFPQRSVRVVANPPFARAATLLAALAKAPGVRAADLVLPRWLVQRWAASPRRRGRFEASAGLSVPTRAFSPAAASPCAVLRLRR